MANSLYLECNSGISGDMSVAALLDLGADIIVLKNALDSIPAKGFKYEIKTVTKSGIAACDFDIILDSEHENHDHDMEYLYGHDHSSDASGVHAHEHTHDHDHDHAHDHEHEHPEADAGHHHDHEHGHAPQHESHEQEHEHHHGHEHPHEHRNLNDVYSIIDKTDMTENARLLAKRIFQIVAEAEAKAHNRPIDQVHFHEVGAIDSIVDVIAIAVCFDNLKIDRVYVPYLAEGRGTIRCAHGILPVPVPATANIASRYGLIFEPIENRGEFVTPTGAAFVAAVKTDDVLPERYSVKKIGMGAGKREYSRPSILRAMLIEEKVPHKGTTECRENTGNINASECGENTGNTTSDSNFSETMYKLETNIDDSTGEQTGYVLEKLFQAGARDVNFIPCFMKKNRPGILLSVICDEKHVSVLENIIFKNTTAIGIRHIKFERTVLPRKTVSVNTKWGSAQVKQVILPDGEIRNYPEYDSVAKICSEQNLPFREVYRELEKV